MRRAASAGVAVVLLAAGCGGSGREAVPPEPPEAFLGRLLGYELSGRFGQSYALLHPGHRRLVSASRYAFCSRDDFRGVELASTRTVLVQDDRIDIPGIPETTSKKVVLRIVLRTPDGVESTLSTLHAVAVHGRWTWFLAPSAVSAYENGACP